MAKSEIYSWRMSPEMKRALEEAARDEETTIAQVLDQIVEEWIRTRRSLDSEEAQRRLHASAYRCFGTLRGQNPRRSEEVRGRIRKRLHGRHANKSPR